LDNEEAAVDGSFFSSHFSPDTDEPSARAFIDAYQALYGIEPTGGDAVRLLLEAAERAGSLDADAIRQQLLATEQYSGATRIAGYNENRQPTKSAVIMTIEDGVKKFYQQVDP
jgi:branched-chain amino acid transport system substrate-binding protein